MTSGSAGGGRGNAAGQGRSPARPAIVAAGRRRRQAAAAVAALALLAGAAAAQPRHVTVQNLTQHPRHEWCSVAVPFARGEVAGVPELHVEGRATVWQPFGARWPDGSLRQALALFRAELPAGRELRLELVAGAGPALEPTEVAPLAPEIEIAVAVGGRELRARPREVAVLEENAARRVVLLRCRVPEVGLVFEVIHERWAGQEHGGADVALFFSDPTTEAVHRHVQRAVVRCRGAALLLRHSGLFALETGLHEEGSDTTLLVDATLADGQGIRRVGVLVPALRGDGSARDLTVLAAAQAPPLGATDWRASAAYGPFGYVPDPPPWLRGAALRTALAGRHRAFVQAGRGRGDPFGSFRFGLARRAAQTGDQEDFGVVKLEAVAGTGLPSFLLEVEPSVLQEACRPVHNFESDGSPVLARNHPDWVVWSGRTHWHCEVSKDRLGKVCPPAKLDAHGWTGKDRQHWSSLYLTGYYLLTGAHWARREIENEVQLYLAAQTIDPRLTTSGPGAPRGAGRVLLTACWLYQCTGDAELLQRMHDRVERIYTPGWFGARVGEDRVRTFQVHRPDARVLQGKHHFWTPWQDALAAVGFAAFHRLSGNRDAGAIADVLALNVLRHGWRAWPGVPPIIATAVRWDDDATPLGEDELRSGDPTTVLWSHGTAFSVWAIGAVELGRQAAARAGDEAMVERAERILEHLRAQRRRPADGWFDRFGQWDAVR